MMPTKYEDLPFRPTHGIVDVRGERSEWGIRVTVEQGRDMERDGIPVIWPYASCPGWVADYGLAWCWMGAQRILTWPSRALR